jgi:hypothetical protein
MEGGFAMAVFVVAAVVAWSGPIERSGPSGREPTTGPALPA